MKKLFENWREFYQQKIIQEQESTGQMSNSVLIGIAYAATASENNKQRDKSNSKKQERIKEAAHWIENKPNEAPPKHLKSVIVSLKRSAISRKDDPKALEYLKSLGETWKVVQIRREKRTDFHTAGVKVAPDTVKVEYRWEKR